MELEMLVRRAKKGDKDAFLELMLLHKEYLYRTAFYIYQKSGHGLRRGPGMHCQSMEAIGQLKKRSFSKAG